MAKNKKEVNIVLETNVDTVPDVVPDVVPDPVLSKPVYEVLIRFNGLDHEGKRVCHEIGDKITLDDMKRVQYYLNSRYVRKVLGETYV